MAHHVIYVPGLGDHKPHGQQAIIKLWRLFGLQPHYLALGWSQADGLEIKLAKLLKLINDLETAENTVSLVGVSAGASAVVNAFSAHKTVHRVVSICGKLVGPETIDQHYFDDNPDFKESVFSADKILKSMKPEELASIMSIHPWRDQTVPIAATRAKGTVEKTLPGWTHATGIFFALTIGAPIIARFIRQK